MLRAYLESSDIARANAYYMFCLTCCTCNRFDDLKEEIWRHFKDFQVIFLATSEQDQPRVRPVTLVYLDGRFWLVTGTNNSKTMQIRKNPRMEFCLLLEKDENRGYVRGAGLAQIIKDRETKAKIAKHCNFFGEYYNSSEDPNYTLIQLQLTEIEYLRPQRPHPTAQKITL